ncbi:Ubiquitin carboxyl-terminal hydrolase 22, partial [Irineochytrium annulatum]
NIIRPTTDRVLLLHCRPASYQMLSGLFADLSESYEEMECELRASSLTMLKRLGAAFDGTGCQVMGVAMRGDPREEIVNKVREVGADVVVCGSKGKGVIERMVRGSVSDYLTRHLETSVVVVP